MFKWSTFYQVIVERLKARRGDALWHGGDFLFRKRRRTRRLKWLYVTLPCSDTSRVVVAQGNADGVFLGVWGKLILKIGPSKVQWSVCCSKDEIVVNDNLPKRWTRSGATSAQSRPFEDKYHSDCTYIERKKECLQYLKIKSNNNVVKSKSNSQIKYGIFKLHKSSISWKSLNSTHPSHFQSWHLGVILHSAKAILIGISVDQVACPKATDGSGRCWSGDLQGGNLEVHKVCPVCLWRCGPLILWLGLQIR